MAIYGNLVNVSDTIVSPLSHIHETIQPVIQKETIQPEVVHTTIPIKEVHHEATQHHGTSQLPPVTMDEFKSQKGRAPGSHSQGAFEGCPQGIHREGCGHDKTATASSHRVETEAGTKKPSLLDRMNPMTDADGDGKKGFMS